MQKKEKDLKVELLTIEEVMKIFHLKNRKTIDNWLYSGTMPRSLTMKIGNRVYFLKEKLEEFLKGTYQKQLEING